MSAACVAFGVAGAVGCLLLAFVSGARARRAGHRIRAIAWWASTPLLGFTGLLMGPLALAAIAVLLVGRRRGGRRQQPVAAVAMVPAVSTLL